MRWGCEWKGMTHKRCCACILKIIVYCLMPFCVLQPNVTPQEYGSATMDGPKVGLFHVRKNKMLVYSRCQKQTLENSIPSWGNSNPNHEQILGVECKKYLERRSAQSSWPFQGANVSEVGCEEERDGVQKFATLGQNFCAVDVLQDKNGMNQNLFGP